LVYRRSRCCATAEIRLTARAVAEYLSGAGISAHRQTLMMRSVGFMLAFVLLAESAVANETIFDLESRIRRHVCKMPYKEYSLDSYEKCQGIINQFHCEEMVDETNLIIIRYNAWIHHCLGLLESKAR
jgi:hypothetical protein